jgi:hypothetical protein
LKSELSQLRSRFHELEVLVAGSKSGPAGAVAARHAAPTDDLKALLSRVSEVEASLATLKQSDDVDSAAHPVGHDVPALHSQLNEVQSLASAAWDLLDEAGKEIDALKAHIKSQDARIDDLATKIASFANLLGAGHDSAVHADEQSDPDDPASRVKQRLAKHKARTAQSDPDSHSVDSDDLLSKHLAKAGATVERMPWAETEQKTVDEYFTHIDDRRRVLRGDVDFQVVDNRGNVLVRVERHHMMCRGPDARGSCELLDSRCQVLEGRLQSVVLHLQSGELGSDCLEILVATSFKLLDARFAERDLLGERRVSRRQRRRVLTAEGLKVTTEFSSELRAYRLDGKAEVFRQRVMQVADGLLERFHAGVDESEMLAARLRRRGRLGDGTDLSEFGLDLGKARLDVVEAGFVRKHGGRRWLRSNGRDVGLQLVDLMQQTFDLTMKFRMFMFGDLALLLQGTHCDEEVTIFFRQRRQCELGGVAFQVDGGGDFSQLVSKIRSDLVGVLARRVVSNGR